MKQFHITVTDTTREGGEDRAYQSDSMTARAYQSDTAVGRRPWRPGPAGRSYQSISDIRLKTNIRPI